MDKRLLNIDEVSEKLGVPKSWVYARTRSNEIPHYRIGKYCRFSEPEVENWYRGKKENRGVPIAPISK